MPLKSTVAGITDSEYRAHRTSTPSISWNECGSSFSFHNTVLNMRQKPARSKSQFDRFIFISTAKRNTGRMKKCNKPTKKVVVFDVNKKSQKILFLGVGHEISKLHVITVTRVEKGLTFRKSSCFGGGVLCIFSFYTVYVRLCTGIVARSL